MWLFGVLCLLLVQVRQHVVAVPPPPLDNQRDRGCRKTKVAILGGGTAGVIAAQSLSNASVDDFLIVEYLGDLGGRVTHTTFGKSSDGTPYTVELGANWVQGIQSDGGAENPIWRLAKKWKLENTYSDYDKMLLYNETGETDYSDLFIPLDDSYALLEQNAGRILAEGLVDYSARAGMALAGWRPRHDPKAGVLEYFYFDFEWGFTPEQTSALYSVVIYNHTFYQWSEENNYVWDSRGFNRFIKGEASEFLNCTKDLDCSGDPRLLLNTIVTNISYSDTGVMVTSEDGSCIEAEYAICTFSLGVLQNDVIAFDPPLPAWKEQAINSIEMATYTKIFLQFPPDQVFWNTSIQFFLYADPLTRGYYPIFQSLDGPGFLEGSGIFFVTVVQDRAYAAEAQDDETTKEQIMEVLRNMYGDDIPMPTAFIYPRWSSTPWAYGSFSNWPPGTTLEQHQNLRANVSRLFFAGEATSVQYLGYLQGAYFEGQYAGELIAGCIAHPQTCKGYESSVDVLGSTQPDEYNVLNGWFESSFETEDTEK